MYAEYKRDVSHNYLIFREEEKVNTASYQVRMLTGNVIPSILKCRLQGLDGNLLFYYDITSRQSLASFYEQRKFHSEDLHMLFGGFICVMEEMAEFLMNTDQLLLCPEYIFLDIEKKEVKFCCLPDYHHPVQEQFRELTEYLLPRLDHEDPVAVSMGYGVYRKAMETGFQLEHIKEAIYQNREPSEKREDRKDSQNLSGTPIYEDGEQNRIDMDVRENPVTENENTKTGRNAEKKAEEGRKRGEKEWTGALICIAVAACLIVLLTLRYMGYLPGVPAETVFAGVIGLLLLAAFLSWTAEKKKEKKQMSAEWRQKVQRELANVDKNEKMSISQKTTEENLAEVSTEFEHFEQEDHKAENYGETVVLSAGQTEGPASLVSREPGELATIYLDRDLMVIGKMENAADAVISLPTVSRVHAKIRKVDEEYYLSDLNSRNGTSVNGRLLKTGEEYQLQDEDQVEFAQARYIFLK